MLDLNSSFIYFLAISVLSLPFRLQVQAVASGTISQQVATAFVNITVIRNANGPIFTQNLYTQTIQDTLPVGSSVIQVFANDDDGDSVLYSVIDGVEAMEYFYLNPITGLISLSKNIYNVGQNSYRFTLRVSDQRVNEKFDTADVLITILRDENQPQFTQEPYSGIVRETDANGTVIARASCFDPDLRGSIIFSAVPYSIASAYFTVDSNSGDIFLYNGGALRLGLPTLYTVSCIFCGCL